MTPGKRLLLGVATLLCLAGCTTLEDKEAQLEFERLRQRTLTPQGDRILPLFGPESSPQDADRSAVARR